MGAAMPTVELSGPQHDVFTDEHRFRVLVAGRRFGKSFLQCTEALQAAWRPGALAWITSPTFKQIKRNVWPILKPLAAPYTARKNETELYIDLIGGGRVQLLGLERYDDLRGAGLDFVSIDEVADVEQEAWTNVLRPALSDRQGRALFCSTPKGLGGILYDLYHAARSGSEPDWSAFSFTTLDGGRVPPEEVEAARRHLDPASFRQEYLASFEDLTTGRVYYAWSESNIRPCLLDPFAPVLVCCDFNRTPMSWLIAQERDGGTAIEVLRELVHIDTDTPQMLPHLRDAIEKLAGPRFQIKLDIYGDASGYAKKSSGGPADWESIRTFFRDYGMATVIHAEKSNPHVRDRVSAVNTLLGDIDGGGFQQRRFVDPSCRELIEDFRKCVWKTDSAGNSVNEIDKRDKRRTHTSDALGYMVYARHRPRSKAQWGTGFVG